MKRDNLKIAITGHIDHGKSTLIGRLLLETKSLPKDKLQEIKKVSKQYGKDTELAYLADQLKEERERNITIDTTEIFMKTSKRDYIFIDTPGHLEFIKNMLTGASHAESAIILVDAQEGVQSQTRRHAYLIRLLTLKNILVIINKMDLIDYDQTKFNNLENEIRQLLEDLNVDCKFIIPISAKNGINISRPSSKMAWYQGPPLLKAMDDIVPEQITEKGVLRFPVQDVYEIEGENIIVGRVASGTVKKGQTLKVLPSGQQSEVETIKVYQENKNSAVCDECIGMTLKDASDIQRGNIFCSVDACSPVVKNFKGNLFWLSKQPLKKGEKITLRCSTQSIAAKIQSIEQRIDPSTFETVEEDASQLHINEAAVLHIKLQTPAVIENFHDLPELGRYTIERDNLLQGAGTVLETKTNE